MFLFSDINIYWEVIAVSSLKVVAYIGAQGIALVLTLFLHHVMTLEDVAVEPGAGGFLNLQLVFGVVYEVLRHDDVVEDVPCVAVGQSAVSGFQHGCVGCVVIALPQLFGLELGAQSLRDAGVGRVVVEVAHQHDFHVGTDLLHRVGDAAHLLAHGYTLVLGRFFAAQTLRPVRHHKEEVLSVYLAPHGEDVTGFEIGQ